MKPICKIIITVLILGVAIFVENGIVNASDEFTSDQIEYKILDENSVAVQKYIGEQDTVQIPEYVEGYQVVEVSKGAFANNKYIRTVSLPKSVVTIDNYAFKLSTLEQINMPDHIKRIGMNAFDRTPILENEKEAVKYIDNVCLGAETDCKLTHLRICIGTRLIAEGAFSNNSSIETVELPQGLKYIGDFAFDYCSNLRTVNFPNGVEIGMYSFYGDKNLTKITGDFDYDKYAIGLGQTKFAILDEVKNIGKKFIILFSSMILFLEAIWIGIKMIKYDSLDK